MDGDILAFSGSVRNRLVNNALLFAAQAWGHIALKDVPGAMGASERNYSYIDDEFAAKLPGPANRFRRAAAYAYVRAKTFFGSLFADGSLRSGSYEPLLVRTQEGGRRRCCCCCSLRMS